jgi:hypothetical protein
MPAKRERLRERIAAQIAWSDDEVFLTREFRRLGCERHVRRALRRLRQMQAEHSAIPSFFLS